MAPVQETSEGQIGWGCVTKLSRNDPLQELMTLPKSSYFIGTSCFNYAMN